MKITRSIALILPLTLWFTTSFPAHAANSLERSELAELIHELDFLRKRVDRLEGDTQAHGRVRFQYSALQADLTRIRDGINRYLNAASQAPNTLTPISGDYLEATP